MPNQTLNRAFAGVVIATAAFLGGMTATAITPAPPVEQQQPPQQEEQQFEVYGTIRWVDKAKWAALNDAGHRSHNIAKVELFNNRVRVHFPKCADKVGYLNVTPDEQFTAAGVRVGSSVGLCYADVFFYMGTSQTPVNPSLLTRKNANVWIDGRFDVAPVKGH